MSSATHQVVLNQGLFEDQEMPNTQMGYFSFPPNLPYNPSVACLQQPQKTFTMSSNSLDTPIIEALLPSALVSKQSGDITSNLLGTQLLSLQRSSANLWIWGEVNNCMSNRRNVVDNHLGVSALKMKKIKSRKKVREPRFSFKTMSDVDVLDDGYKWRKYGQKVVKNTQHPRSYYRCTQDNCRVKKRIERLAEDPRMVITTYEGRHVHSPSRDMEDTENQSQLNNFFW